MGVIGAVVGIFLCFLIVKDALHRRYQNEERRARQDAVNAKRFKQSDGESPAEYKARMRRMWEGDNV